MTGFSVSPRGYVDARKGDEPGESAHGNDNSPKIPESQRLTRAPLVRYEGRAFIAFMSPWSPRALCSSRHPDVVRHESVSVDGRVHPTWSLLCRVPFSHWVSYFGHFGPFSGRSSLHS